MSESSQEDLERVAAELQFIAGVHDCDPDPEILSAIAEWHLRAIAAARAEVWVPGMAGSRDPAVADLLSRFYSHHIKTAISRLNAETTELRLQLLTALGALNFYAKGAPDSGARARAALRLLLETANRERHHEAVGPVAGACCGEAVTGSPIRTCGTQVSTAVSGRS